MGTTEDLVQACVENGVRSGAVLEAVRSVDRAHFAGDAPGARSSAYEDRPIGIGEGQTTSQPSLVAGMIEALEPGPADRALEVGTGYGYQTALLSRVCGEVVSIERFGSLLQQARVNLTVAGIHNVVLIEGDGGLGAPKYAPFNIIIGSAAAPRIPPPLIEQLADDGRLVFPVGPGGRESVLLYRKVGGELQQERLLTGARYVRMVGKYSHDHE